MATQRQSIMGKWGKRLYLLSLFALVFTGFGQLPIFKRYYLADIPGLDIASLGMRKLHTRKPHTTNPISATTIRKLTTGTIRRINRKAAISMMQDVLRTTSPPRTTMKAAWIRSPAAAEASASPPTEPKARLPSHRVAQVADQSLSSRPPLASWRSFSLPSTPIFFFRFCSAQIRHDPSPLPLLRKSKTASPLWTHPERRRRGSSATAPQRSRSRNATLMSPSRL